MDIVKIFNYLEIDIEEYKKALLSTIVESKCDSIFPEHILAALIKIPDSYIHRRIKQQRLNPNNVYKVLTQCVEQTDRKLPPVFSIEEASHNQKLNDLEQKLNEWLAQNKKIQKIKDRDFAGLIVNFIENDVIENLIEFARLDWEDLVSNLSWPPTIVEKSIQIWSKESSNLMVDTCFDKSGKKLINALIAEVEGLGLKQYSAEALFIALLNFEPSILELAISTQLTSKDSYIVSTKDLGLELRNSIRRPRIMKNLGNISQGNCTEILISIFNKASEIASNEGKTKISVRDVAESLSWTESKGRLGKLLKAFGVDLNKVYDFLETYTEELEEELILVPITQLEQKVKEKIIGQNHAVERILPLIKRLRFGYRRPGKPAGVFLFMGPSGTGKTQMAKVLAEILYGSEENMLMLEMGQFGTKETKSMFIGAAPGYVGYGEGKLTNGLRDNPECVILFDEVEKADPLVLDVLLRFLDEGKIDDPAGPVRDGSKCLIILTSNFFADKLHEFEEQIESTDNSQKEEMYKNLRNALLDVGKSEGQNEKVQKFFRPEFIFRIDEIILFRSFNRDNYKKIAELGLENEIAYLKKNYDYNVSYDKKILDMIAIESVKRSNEGARVINRLINVHVVNPIIDFLTAHPSEDFDHLTVSYNKNTKLINVSKKS
ncbi:MAG: AAA domain-containing protein [Candidatus Lokiarchaeota archaeon]|nr:AAA domain-containing protein [Candidatus Lokiarchaeota archaeon]